ncbi:MAG: hypothetical protein MI861_09180, partial [Pirellulales bacterium]|nr:hypothetical protein [Pirellulales bacterium]
GLAADGGGGGGISAGVRTDLVLENVVIQNNVAAGIVGVPGSFSSGGGIQALGNVSINQSTLRDNVATLDGGAIDYAAGTAGKTLNVTNSTIIGNSAAFNGGGVLLADISTSATFNNVDFTNNEGSDSGGGIFSDGAAITVIDSNFTGNRATLPDSGGGGLYIFGDVGTPSFTVTNTNFQNNQAVDGAGGLEVVNAAGTISAGTYDANRVTGNGSTFDQGGGGIVIIGNQTGAPPAVLISGVTLQNNVAPAAGGLALVDANVTIQDSMIQNNRTTDPLTGGGGIGGINSVPGAPLTINRSVIAGNTTAAEGGGIGTVDLSVLVTDSTIEGNSAAGGRAGGIGLLGNLIASTLTLDSSTINNNQSDGNGGGIGVAQAGLNLSNVTVSDNVSQNGAGGGIFYQNDRAAVSSSISYSTIADNTSAAEGANLRAQGTVPVSIGDSIFSGIGCSVIGGAATSSGFNIDSGTSCGFNLPTDSNNTDPLLGPLADNGGLVFTRALATGSPAIDAASDVFPAEDARGVLRPQDGDGDFDGVADIGAFEALTIVIPNLTIDDVFFEESTGNATVLVTLDIDTAGPFSVEFNTQDVTANSGSDFQPTSGTLNFAGNANEQQAIVIPILDDDVAELDEQFQVSLNSPTIAADVSDVGLVSLFDDDMAVLTVNDATAVEDSNTIRFDIVLSGQTDAPFTIDVATLDLPGGAVAGQDYVAGTSTLTFTGNDGETQTFTVDLIADQVTEADESFGVEVTNIQAGSRDLQFDNFADRVDVSVAGQFAVGGISANDIVLFTPAPATTIAYVADDSGLLVLDVSNPANIVQLGAFPLADGAFQIDTVDVAFFDGVVFVAAGDQGLQILDVSDPSNIQRLGAFSVAGRRALSLARDGSIVYLGETDAAGTNGGLRILETNQPSNIQELDNVQGNLPTALDIANNGNLVLVAGSTGGLQVVDVTDPTNAVIAGTFTAATATSVALDNDIAYIGTPTGLRIIDPLSFPNFVELGSFATSDPINAVDVRDATDPGRQSAIVVSILDQSGAYRVLRADDPANIEELGSLQLADVGQGFDSEGLTAFIAASGGGVQVVQNSLTSQAVGT